MPAYLLNKLVFEMNRQKLIDANLCDLVLKQELFNSTLFEMPFDMSEVPGFAVSLGKKHVFEVCVDTDEFDNILIRQPPKQIPSDHNRANYEHRLKY